MPTKGQPAMIEFCQVILVHVSTSLKVQANMNPSASRVASVISSPVLLTTPMMLVLDPIIYLALIMLTPTWVAPNTIESLNEMF